VQLFKGLNQPPKRYLTLFYCLTLALAVILALLAISLDMERTPEIVDIQQATPTSTAAITSENKTSDGPTTPTEIPPVPPTPNEVTPSTLGVTSADLQNIQVSLWHPWSGPLAAQLQSILEDYSRTNKWGITVNITGYEDFGRLHEAVESSVISGTLPDILIDYGYEAQNLDADEVLADLSPYVNDPVWGLTSAEQADFYPGFWAEDLVSGPGTGPTRRLGLPFYRSGYLLFYNQSWASELGFKNSPVTPEEFKQQACAATKAAAAREGNSDLGQGGWLITDQPGVAAGWIFAYGGDITDPAETGYRLNTPETQQAFEFIRGLVDRGCAWSDPALEARTSFARRGALFMVGSLLDIPSQQEAFTEAGNPDQWLVIPFPSPIQPAVDTYGPSLIITRSDPIKQLAAWLVLKWLVYPHNQIAWIDAIQAYPTRQSVTTYLLDEAQDDGTQWIQALRLITDAHSEPTLASWKMVRWVLSDAINELTGPKFKIDQIPALLEKLDGLASDISSQVH
jgi:multiple sugar transport system substrate-binding protein